MAVAVPPGRKERGRKEWGGGTKQRTFVGDAKEGIGDEERRWRIEQGCPTEKSNVKIKKSSRTILQKVFINNVVSSYLVFFLKKIAL